MDIPTFISSLRLANSLIPEKKSASEERRFLYDSLTGQKISFTPEVGEEVALQLRNCAYEDGENTTFLTVSVNDPNRTRSLFDIETDFRYHYVSIYFQSSSERSSPLVDKLTFIEIGPKDFKIDMRVRSTDPPTLQMAFERVETVISQIHTKYHRYLRSQCEKYKREFDVSKSFEQTKFRYESESNLDREVLIPQPGEDDFQLHSLSEEMTPMDRIQISNYAYEYIKHVVLAEAGEEEYFVLV